MSDRSPVGARDFSDTEIWTTAKGLGLLFKANACSQCSAIVSGRRTSSLLVAGSSADSVRV